MPSARRSSWPRDPTQVSCIARIGRGILYYQVHLESPKSEEEMLREKSEANRGPPELESLKGEPLKTGWKEVGREKGGRPVECSVRKVKVAQSCPTLCDPMDYMVHGILQARIQEWVAFPFSRGSSQPRDQTQVSCIAGRFFTSWATRETHKCQESNAKLMCQGRNIQSLKAAEILSSVRQKCVHWI